MGNKSFTLMEMIVVVIVIGILATLAIPTYQKALEDSDARVCAVNLRALQTALDIYAMEHDRMPGNLSELPGEYVNRAYAKILQEKGAWKIRLAYFIINWQERGLAHAAFLRDNVVKGDSRATTCRKAGTGNSYGVNTAVLLTNMTSVAYQAIPIGSLLIADSNSTTFSGASGIAARHKATRGMGGISAGQFYGMGTRKGLKELQVCSGNCYPCYAGSGCP